MGGSQIENQLGLSTEKQSMDISMRKSTVHAASATKNVQQQFLNLPDMNTTNLIIMQQNGEDGNSPMNRST